MHPHPHPNPSPPTPHTSPPPTSPQAPESLIIGLFALRLTKHLIQRLDPYPDQPTDLAWLTIFLAPYHPAYALAPVSGPRKHDYLTTYPRVVARMKRQPRYPVRFMQMNPDGCAGAPRAGGTGDARGLSDGGERLARIDFCDAAGEWGSVVPLPAREAGRMVELAGLRRVAEGDSRL